MTHLNTTNNTNNGLGFRAMALVAAVTFTGSLAFAQNPQPQRFVSLGYSASPVIQALKAGKESLDGREMMKAMRAASERNGGPPLSKQGMQASVRAKLAGVSALIADLGELELTESDLTMIEAANDAGIPVVLENVTGEKLASVFGAGVDNSLVVAEFDPRTRMGQLNFAEPLKVDENFEGAEIPRTADRLSFSARLKFVQEIIEKRPFTKGARPQAVSDLGACTVTGSSLLPANACKEWRTSGLGPVYFCPYQGYGNPSYTCEHGMPWYDPEFEFGVYQVGPNKYIRLRAIGGFGMNMTGATVQSSNTERFPYFNQFRVAFTPNFTGTDFSISRLAPANANSTTSFSTTTGWSVGVDGSVSSGGPSAGLNVSYNQSTTTTMEVTDWSARNTSTGANASWVYYMSNTTNCQDSARPIGFYDNLLDKMFSWCTPSAKYTVNKIPGWSTNGYSYYDPFAEATWWGHTAASIPVQYKVGVQVNNAWTTSTGWNWHTAYDSRSSTGTLWINTGSVSQ
jgi:hypothetical protein